MGTADGEKYDDLISAFKAKDSGREILYKLGREIVIYIGFATAFAMFTFYSTLSLLIGGIFVASAMLTPIKGLIFDSITFKAVKYCIRKMYKLLVPNIVREGFRKIKVKIDKNWKRNYCTLKIVLNGQNMILRGREYALMNINIHLKNLIALKGIKGSLIPEGEISECDDDNKTFAKKIIVNRSTKQMPTTIRRIKCTIPGVIDGEEKFTIAGDGSVMKSFICKVVGPLNIDSNREYRGTQ